MSCSFAGKSRKGLQEKTRELPPSGKQPWTTSTPEFCSFAVNVSILFDLFLSRRFRKWITLVYGYSVIAGCVSGLPVVTFKCKYAEKENILYSLGRMASDDLTVTDSQTNDSSMFYDCSLLCSLGPFQNCK